MNCYNSIEEIKKLTQVKNQTELIELFSGAKINNEIITTKTIKIIPNIIYSIKDIVESKFSSSTKFALLVDKNTYEVAGKYLYKQFDKPLLLNLNPLPGWKYLTPHVSLAKPLIEDKNYYDVLIAIGSGTINDLAKYISYKRGIPYFTIATAPSMNGYTSSSASLIKNKVKETINCKSPIAIYADLNIISKAPLAMIQAGYADLLSQCIAQVDWKLSFLIKNTYFNEIPNIITKNAIIKCISHAESIKHQDKEAIKILMEGLILSGYSMSIVRSSAPASGGEHLISHYLDLEAFNSGRHPALHGIQVGLAAILTSKLYELIFYNHPDQITKRFPNITNKGDEICKEIIPLMKKTNTFKKNLMDVGLKIDLHEYNISRKSIHEAFLYSVNLRNRYTILHLARDIGLLKKLDKKVLNASLI